MRKRMIVFSVILAIVLTGLPLGECRGIPASSVQAAETKFSGGDGTAANPYQIANADDLKKLSDDVYLGNEYPGSYFCLTNDIDLSKYSDGEGWKPIGGVGKYDTEIFKGNFDGQNHVIKNLVINRPDEDYCGLFGYVKNGYIKNINIENCSISAAFYVGALAGLSDNTILISNCSITGSVQGIGTVGGVVGYNYPASYSIIEQIYADIDVTGNAATKGTFSAAAYVGGITGESVGPGIIKNCLVNGILSAFTSSSSEYADIGGISGETTYTKIMGCTVLAEINKTQASYGYAGGICGCWRNSYGNDVIFCEFLGNLNCTKSNSFIGDPVSSNEVKFSLSNCSLTEKEKNSDIFTECYFADDAKSEENLAKMKTFVDEYNAYLAGKGEATFDYEYVPDRYNEYGGYPILNTFAKYNVSFYDGDTLIDKQRVMYGRDATTPILEKECMELSWDGSFRNITQDAELHAVWTEDHDYQTPTYEWSEDGKSCVAVFTCKNNVEHTETQNCIITNAVKIPATCAEMGVTAYTASCQNGNTKYSDTLDVKDIAIDANKHDYQTPAFEWSENGKSCVAVFTCKNDSNHTERKDCTITSAVKVPATSEKMGTTTYTATYKNANTTYTDVKDVIDIPKLVKTPEPPNVITDTDNKASYKVTKLTTAGGTVQYTAPADKKAKTVVIPDTVTADGVTYKVTSIAKNAFKGYTNVTSVKIGNNITGIPSNAFANCKKLKSITIGKNVTTIGDKAFYKCTAITKITIPSKVKKIGKSAFYGCKKLKKITVTAGKLKTIGKKAFKGIHKKAAFKVKGAKKAKSAFKKKLKFKKTGYVKTWKIK